MAETEWWVMRVVVPAGKRASDQQALDVERGALVLVNGEICEPIDLATGKDGQKRARELMAKLAASNPRWVYKLVMSTDDL